MEGFLRPRGNVRELIVYKKATCVTMVTEYFVKHYIDRKSRTVDQMQQAARSCKQNIVEGSAAATTSRETEIKLTNVARASLDELLEDYRDYLDKKGLIPWEKGSDAYNRLRAYTQSPNFYNEYSLLLPRLGDERICNLAITLIRQTQYLLDRMLVAQQARFLKEGGIREQMRRARLEYRDRHRGEDKEE